MGKKLTRTGLEAALKRAGKVATTGPRSSRAGRVIPAGPPKQLPSGYVVSHISSTAIKQIAYDRARKELKLTFVSGRTYVYEDVPIDAYEELLSAESQGAYFNHRIRDAYEYREVR
jgi:hypothetical protein